ncbi:unnamed protein product [Mytilus coruscus]|uniref:Endonuclease/exonuclease/phosphatase domain-containing protein n=1 Tax=Mytilus coruscus TaxID=42192 RepID=A0A6J8BWJ5_MYTCO|nr:unnamed protein product [Mytilus coruscus]
MSGDIAQNPGPIKYPCGICCKPTKEKSAGYQCEGCLFWHHIKCINMPIHEYNELSNNIRELVLQIVYITIFDKFIFRAVNQRETADLSYLPCHSTTISGLTDVNIGKSGAKDNMHEDVFEELKKVRSSNTSNLMCGYLNINSLRYKFEPIKDLLHRNLVDILFLSETKIDESFPNAQFCVDNFTIWRADRNQHGGGLIAYVRSDLAADRKIQLEFSGVESIGIEVAIGNKKMVLLWDI